MKSPVTSEMPTVAFEAYVCKRAIPSLPAPFGLVVRDQPSELLTVETQRL